MRNPALDQLIPVDVFVRTNSGRTVSRWELEHDAYDQSQDTLPAHHERANEIKSYLLRVPRRTEDTFNLKKPHDPKP